MSWWPWKPQQSMEEHLASALRKIQDNGGAGQVIPLTLNEYQAFTRHPMPTSEQSIISEIFAIRVANNVPWKRLMEIALKHAPEETRAVLRQINENDRKVSDLLAELAK